MGIIKTLALRHLLNNRKRTAVTILRISTATALISAILIGTFFFFPFFGYLATQVDGNVCAVFCKLTKGEAEKLNCDDRVDLVGVSDTDPLISGVRLLGDTADRFRVGNIAQGDAGYMAEMVLGDYEGTLDHDASEIAVGKAFLEDNGLRARVGDTHAFERGNRHAVSSSRGGRERRDRPSGRQPPVGRGL